MPRGTNLSALWRALTWDYGHVAVFAGVAVVGGAMRVLVLEAETASATTLMALAVTVYKMALWLTRDSFCMSGRALWLLPAARQGWSRSRCCRGRHRNP